MRAERELVSIQERPTIVEFVNNFHLGGTEGQAVELLRGLAERFQPRAAAIHLAGAHLPAVRALGLEPFEVPLAGSVARAHTLAQIARLAGYLRRERVQLVHAHDFYTALLAVPAAKLARTAVIVGRLDLAHWHGPVQRLALAAATRGADHVVANAEAIKRQLLERERLPEERITVIRNGIDLACFDRAQKHALEAPLPPLGGRRVSARGAHMTRRVEAPEDLV
ncbi:MAG: glycosyltransferase, partial [Deltaproteobacteria bacterium]|nr:glycosyltransferase [Deltaproteobacteria bacterium]